MAFLLADSFRSSLDKLNDEEQKAANLAAFELQINPANPGLLCHRGTYQRCCPRVMPGLSTLTQVYCALLFMGHA
jgi:hypothetical protein